MNPEQSFDQYRLAQLTEQLLSETPVSGSIVFFADEAEGRISGATWRFEDDDQKRLRESSFKFLFMELLDTLIQYRARQGNTDTLNGIVQIKGASPNIQWLTASETEQRRGGG